MDDRIYLEPYINEHGQLSLRDQDGRDLSGVAAIRVVQSWNAAVPLGGGKKDGFGIVSVDLVIKPRPPT